MEARRDGYLISTDPARLDREAIWEFLRTSYWSPGVPREVVERAIAGSVPFGLYAPDGGQAGFARVVTDHATFAWIADLYVVEAHRSRGLGKWLVETVLSHTDRDGPRRVMLATADAHSLYARFGFGEPDVDRLMVRWPEPGP